jgi:hypothetical protein
VGALEGGLGAGASRHPQAVDAVDCRAGDPPRRLGAGPHPGAGLQHRAGQDPDPVREQANTHDGAARLCVEVHHSHPGVYPPDMALHWVNDVTRLERGDRSVLSEEALVLVMGKLTPNPSSDDFITPPASCQPLCVDQAVRSILVVAMPSMDDVGIAQI